MAVFAKTEIDVLREAIRKAVLVPTEDPFETSDQQSVAESSSRRDQLKLAIRIWTALGKFIRSQCLKGRVIDSWQFGSFAKASTIGRSGVDAEDYYVYCAGPNSAFTNQENRDNVPDIAQSILEEKLVQLNLSSIAAVCRCTLESVKALFAAVKNEIVEFVHVRGHHLSLNLMVGQLQYNASGSVEFKSANASDSVSNFSAMLPSDMRSKCSEGLGTDRSLRAMQVDQAGCKSPVLPVTQKRGGTFVHKKRMRETYSSNENGQNPEDFGHLSRFLKEQIDGRKQRSMCTGGSRGSRRSAALSGGGNNTIIEQAAQLQLRNDTLGVKNLVEQSKAGDNIEKVKMQTIQNGEKDFQTMSITHIHRPQYTSPGLDHLKHHQEKGTRTPSMQNSQRIMPGIQEIGMYFHRDGITDERALYRHTDEKLNNQISKSVNRKNVSYAYHTGYPIMMNAQGPYAVYSHMKRQGEQAYQGERKTRKAAYGRFEDDLRNMAAERTNQRDQFFGNIKEEQILCQQERQFQLDINKSNQDYIKEQIKADIESRVKARVEELKFKKPHFGPEETADVIEDLTYEERLKKHTVRHNLQAQIIHREDQRKLNDAQEKQVDRENLERFIAEQNAEMQAQKEKIINDKRKLKKAWEKQAAMRNDQEYRDNQFK